MSKSKGYKARQRKQRTKQRLAKRVLEKVTP